MLKIVNSWSPNPWSPAFAGAPRSMGQTPIPLVSPSAVSDKVVAAGVGALVLGLTTVGVLFSYGLAKEGRSKLVKTTGYITAGVGAVAALSQAASLVMGLAK